MRTEGVRNESYGRRHRHRRDAPVPSDESTSVAPSPSLARRAAVDVPHPQTNEEHHVHHPGPHPRRRQGRHRGGGHDTISEFRKHGTDMIDIKAGLASSAAQVIGSASADEGGNAVLHLGNGVNITLLGIGTEGLKADMFHIIT